jgi:hypothetical protein
MPQARSCLLVGIYLFLEVALLDWRENLRAQEATELGVAGQCFGFWWILGRFRCNCTEESESLQILIHWAANRFDSNDSIHNVEFESQRIGSNSHEESPNHTDG